MHTVRPDPSTKTVVSTTTSFDDLYRLEYSAVALVAGSTAGSWPVGEEVAQEAFTKAHQQWDYVCSLDRPGAWVRRVAINLALNHRRSNDREQRAMERLPRRADGESLDEADTTLWQAVASLAPKQRAAVVLHYHDGYPTAEIALLLETSVSAVTSSLHKARATLAKTLGETR